MGELNTQLQQQAKGVSLRATSIRARTLLLTGIILLTLIIYLFATFVTETFDVLEFTLVAILQILIYTIYYPDGEIFGAKNATFIANRADYNIKANAINKLRKIGQLREYCKVDFERRKTHYIETECAKLGISVDDLETLRGKTENEIKSLKFVEIDGKLIPFNKHKRKKLYKLLFKPLPVTENFPETIMSAVEHDSNKAIQDESIGFKARQFVSKILKATVIGGLFAYIGYRARDGVGIAEVLSVCMYVGAILTNAVVAFSAGEKTVTSYKNRFYVSLSNFIDGFFEWAGIELPNENE